jgi:predicted O-linked N-acetylglucosamine transferase (SPINDLY family)
LRVGFVSGDFRRHSVGRFFLTVLQALSASSQLVLHAYSATRLADDVTAVMRNQFNSWRLIAGLSDDAVAHQIRADGIDVLIDLSGHTKYHRLGVFVRKPAPIQITWLGYFGTTGLSEIDYLLAGQFDVMSNEECWYTEKVWRFSQSRLCFAKPDCEVPVSDPPCVKAGHVVFGSFSTVKKVNDSVVQRWTQVLNAVPNSQLLMKAKELVSDEVRAELTKRFVSAGLTDISRLRFAGPTPFSDYMATYAKVDIVLDTFPYTGGTTTMQALWMGVPVLTMAGDRLLSRQGESMLRVLSLEDWIATDALDYVQRAQLHATQPEKLLELRRAQRQRVERSVLMDAQHFAQDLESALRTMWRRHLATSCHND